MFRCDVCDAMVDEMPTKKLVKGQLDEQWCGTCTIEIARAEDPELVEAA
jgi:hypothetical protein